MAAGAIAQQFYRIAISASGGSTTSVNAHFVSLNGAADGVSPPPPPAGNILINGSFEQPVVAPGQAQTFGSIPGWTPYLAFPQIDVWNNRIGLTASDGVNFIELDSTSSQDGFFQNVQTTAGQTYTLQLDAMRRPEHPEWSMGIEVLWNGVVVRAIAMPGANWTTYSVDVTGTGGLDRLTIREDATQGFDGSGPLIDNVRLATAGPAPVAQPALISFGLGSDENVALKPLDVDGVQVNTYTNSFQLAPSVAALKVGGHVVTWTSDGPDGSSYGIFGQRYDDVGRPVAGEFQINTSSVGLQERSSVAALSEGGFVVAWVSWQTGEIHAQIYNAAGARSGGEFQVNTFTNNIQQHANAIGLSGGGFVVTWTSFGQDGSSEGVYAQRYGASGAVIGPEFSVNTATNQTQAWQAAAALADGGFVVTWVSFPQDGSGLGVYAQRYDASGVAVGSEFRVNTFTDGEQRHPSVAAMSDGGFVVAWTSHNQDGSGEGVYARVYNALGAPTFTEFRVNTATTGNQKYPHAIGLPDGNFVITYLADDGAGSSLWAERFLSTGTFVHRPYAPVHLAALGSETSQWERALDVTEDGVLIQVFDGGGTGGEIFTRRFATQSGFSTGEDEATPFQIGVTASERGDAVTQVVLSGLPFGSVLSAGAPSAGGTTWTFAGPPPLDLMFSPPPDYNGSFTLTVTATTQDGGDTETATATKSVTITAHNDVPVLANPIPDQTAPINQPFNFQFAPNTFFDVDGPPLTYTARLEGGAPLPAWLSFDAATRTFSGTPTTATTLNIVVIATDSSIPVSDMFALVVSGSGANLPPLVTADSVTTVEEVATEIAVLGNDSDPEGVALSVSHINGTAVASGSSVDVGPASVTRNANNTLTVTPDADFNGPINFTYRASDGVNGTDANVAVTVVPFNDPPVVANRIPDQGAQLNQAFSFQFAANTFFDVDSPSLTYSSSHIDTPALDWLSFDAATRTFSGTPTTASAHLITVLATDGSRSTVDKFLLFTGDPPNFWPIPVENSAFTNEGSAVTVAVLSNDSDPEGVALSVSHIDGRAVAIGGSVDVASGRASVTRNADNTLTFTPDPETTGEINFTYRANDGVNGIDAWVSVFVYNVNDAPVVANAIPDQTATVNQAFSFTFSSSTFQDIDSTETFTARQVGGAALPTWLSFNATTRTFSGTPTTSGAVNVEVIASDGEFSATDAFLINVGTSPPPPPGNLLVNGSFEQPTVPAGQGQGFTSVPGWTLLAGSQMDIWNNRIGLTANNGVNFIELDATSAQDGFYQDVQTSAGQPYTIQLDAKLRPDHPANSMGVQVLWNGALVSTIAPNVNWTTHSVDVAGTGGLDRLTIREVAAQGADGSGPLLDNVRLTGSGPPPPPNLAPIVAADSATTNEDNAVTISVLGNDSDPEGVALSVSHLNGTAVASGGSVDVGPANVTRNANNTLTVTPDADFNGPINFTYRASDGVNGVDANVSVTVSPVNDAPQVANVIPDQTATVNQAFSFGFASNAFTDVDSSLSFTARQVGGAALPAWLLFNATTRAFSGTPTSSGPINVEVIASDGSLQATDAFLINIGTTPPPSGNMLVNGSFEQPSVTPGTSQSFASAPGWTAIAGGAIEIWNNRIGLSASQGTNFLELDNNGAAQDGFYQDVQTANGQAYTLQLDAKLRPEHPSSSMQIQVLWNGALVSTMSPNVNWTNHSVSVTGTGGLDRLTVREVASQGGDGYGALLDNFRFIADPAPQSALFTQNAAPFEEDAFLYTAPLGDIDAMSAPQADAVRIAAAAQAQAALAYAHEAPLFGSDDDGATQSSVLHDPFLRPDDLFLVG